MFYYGAPTSQLSKIVHPLLRLLNTSPEVERVVVVYLLVITKSAPVSPEDSALAQSDEQF